MTTPRVDGTIYDIGYQHYDGPRHGRAAAIRTLAGYSFRAAFGSGRGPRSRAIPLVITALVFGVALVRIIGSASLGPQMIQYDTQFRLVGLFLALFGAAQAPELIVSDRQFGVLPLYLSRSLRPLDYAFSKWLAMVGALLVLTLGPELLLFGGRIFMDPDHWKAFQTEWHQLGPILGASVAAAIYVGAIVLAIGAYSRKRSYAAAAIIAFFFVMPALSGIIGRLVALEHRLYVAVLNPFVVLNSSVSWIFGTPQAPMVVIRQRGGIVKTLTPLPGSTFFIAMAVTTVLALALLAARFRKERE